MFGKKSLPARIYAYGARPPCAGGELVDQQMSLAHRYRNQLVEIELERRKEVEAALRSISPGLILIEAEIAGVEGKLQAARALIDEASQKARKKVRPPEAVEATKLAREELKELRSKRKLLRTELFESEAWKVEQERINEKTVVAQKKLRGETELFWGSYLHVEQSMSGCRAGAPPKFHRWNGDGHLAVQLQGGIPARDIFDPDTRFYIDRVPDEAWERGGRKLQRTKAHFRVGSDPKGSPVFAEIPMVMHRPIPDDAVLKWVHLTRRRIGTHCEWRVQLVLTREAGWPRPDQATDGTVGIDVGWRMKPDGSMRVAYYKGSDGEEGELEIPAYWLGEMKKTRDIQSIRDRLFDEARPIFAKGLKFLSLPDWLKEASESLHLWKSQARLASLAIRWRTERFKGDDVVFDAIENWRKRDKHLLEYGANLRDQLQRNREDLYRVFAAKLRRKYKTAAIEDLDLRDFHVLPNTEEKSPDGALREHTRDAALSVLIRCLKESMAVTIEVPAKNTTKLHQCGSIEEWDRKELTHTCSKCGQTYDQDACAARNILSLVSGSAVEASV